MCNTDKVGIQSIAATQLLTVAIQPAMYIITSFATITAAHAAPYFGIWAVLLLGWNKT